jgi:hypothetical protein
MMLRSAALAGLALLLFGTPAKTDVVVFATLSPSADLSVDDGGFYVSSSGIVMADAPAFLSGSSSSLFPIGASPSSSDAGIVPFFNGGLTLEELPGVTAVTEDPPAADGGL